MKIYKLLPIICLFLFLGGCRKQSPDLINQNENQMLWSPSKTFLSYWHGMNNSYAFWDIDPTDWDKVYDEYLPRFQALDSLKEVSTYQLSKLYTELSKDLIDHHYFASITNSRAHADSINEVIIRPSDNQLKKRNYYHEQDAHFLESLRTVFRNYEADNRITDSKFIEYPSKDPDVGTIIVHNCNIDNGIVYIYFSSFYLSELLGDPKYLNETNPVLTFLDMIVNMEGLRGVVIDMRNNGGGSTADIQYIVGSMLGEDLQIGYTRPKNGLGRYDYGDWVPLTIHPAQLHRKIDVPIVALVNLHSVSMSEISSSAIKMLDNGYVIGERTYGGTGPITSDYTYNYGGPFKNTNVNVYSSVVITKFLKGGIIEGIGVTPDIEILDDPKALSEGIDRQLEAALKLIKEKSKK